MHAELLHYRLTSFIGRQFAAHEQLDLRDFAFRTMLFHHLDGEMITFLSENRRFVMTHCANALYREALVNSFISGIIRYTFKRNQFIRFSRSHQNLVIVEYRDFINRLCSSLNCRFSREQLAKILSDIHKTHLDRLRAILLSCTGVTRSNTDNSYFLQSVICNEYSADFQRNILGISGAIEEPVLDIGCGKGTLVSALTAEGIDAYGIDRCAPSEKHMITLDWFDAGFTPDRWGTVLAHQSLSTHFTFHHGHGTPDALRYAALFMSVLASLKIGGTMYYAPGLPFFEPEIEKFGNFLIRKTQLSLDGPSAIGNITYSTAITRLG